MINDAGRQVYTKNNENTSFSRQTTLYTHILKVYTNFQRKIFFSLNYQTYRHYPFKTERLLFSLLEEKNIYYKSKIYVFTWLI
jgi:hypothetical protein